MANIYRKGGQSMSCKRIGQDTIRFTRPPVFRAWANCGGKMEAQGPLASSFDTLEPDSFFGEKTWEAAESAMQIRCLSQALKKGGLTADRLSLAFGGDLLNQCTGTSFAMRHHGVPFCGVYSACASMGESLLLAAMSVASGAALSAAAMASSHYCTAERQYRTPLPYGSQRAPTAQWTATACGCCVLTAEGGGPRVTAAVPGRVTDLGLTDSCNMGAAMAPAAYHTISAYFRDTGEGPGDFDCILTGDLGKFGHALLIELFRRDGVDLTKNYTDCGLLLYDIEGQDMHCGGSGAGCSAAVLAGYLLGKLAADRWRRILFAPTGALLSPTSVFQGESIPGICHAVVIESGKEAQS